jgi:hypothetical protein
MHYIAKPSDRPAPDVDADGYDPRAHFAPPARRVVYVVEHHDRVVSREYDSFTEAELFRLFDTPGTDAYRVVPVRSTQPGA